MNNGTIEPAVGARLAELEAVIDRGLRTFVAVGSALLEIRESRLYRDDHETFEGYCQARWNFTRSRASQLIVAAKVMANLEAGPGVSTPVDRPDNEAQVRPLIPLEPAEQAEAWSRAVAAAPDGRPTRKQVERAAEAVRGGNGHANGHTANGNGKSRVNGELRDDPPDVAAARATGRIAAEVVVDITEPEAEPGSAAETETETEAGELDDGAWLETLPACGALRGRPLKMFRADALVYRALEAARKTFHHHASRAIRPGGAYAYRVQRFLRTEHPMHWVVCPATEHGGCGGTGEIAPVGQCPRCRGRGYYIP